jgi:RimJ/RimL family protein N-acetyltransferase
MNISADRLVLREFTPLDLDDLARVLADPQVMHFSISGPLSKEQAEYMLQKRILEHYAKHGFGLWAIIDKKDKAFVGFAGLIIQNIDQIEEIELGFRLDPAYWGKGLATEAAAAICEYAFNQLKIDHLICIIDPKNKRSLNVADRLGMRYWKDHLFHGTPVHIYLLFKAGLTPNIPIKIKKNQYLA